MDKRVAWNKGKHHSVETKAKMSKSHMGNTSGRFLKGIKFTEEHKQRISQSETGKKVSEETCQRISASKLGKPNLLLRGKPLTEQTRSKLSITKKTQWQQKSEDEKEKFRKMNLGRHHSRETKDQMSLQRKGRKMPIGCNVGEKNPMYNQHHTDKTKQIISQKNKGKNIGRKLSEETKHKMSTGRIGICFSEDHKKHISESRIGMKASLEAKKNLSRALKGNPKVIKHLSILWGKVPKTSKPQKELFFLLKQIFPDAKMEHLVITKKTCRFIDIAVPSLKIAFEYDGAYWHDMRKESDKIRDKELAEVGWATFRINKESLKILSQQKIFALMKNGDSL